MLYYFVRPFATLSFFLFFRKIYHKNIELVPKDKPILLASNHPSAFLEACLYACLLPQPLYFLTRGDVFKEGIINKILYSLNLIPIYRFRDGYANMKNNLATFTICYKALREKKTIIIFPEGRTKLIKRCDPAQKGAARIAFGAYEQYGDIDLQIVPIGVNYANGKKFRDDVMVQVGEPIALRNYYDTFAKNENTAVKLLTQDLTVALKKNIIHIEHDEDTKLTEYVFTIFRHEQPYKILPIKVEDNFFLLSEKTLAEKIAVLSSDQKNDLLAKFNTYFGALSKHKLSNYAFGKQNYFSFFGLITLIIGFIPFICGMISNFFPILCSKIIADKKVTSVEFYAPTLWAIWVLLSMLYSVVILIISLCSFGLKFGVFIWLLLFFWGYFSLIYYDFFKRWWSGFKLWMLHKSDKTILYEKYQTVKSLVDNL
ncbi:MAG: 1-acyl-sn-glycerol-3-phosphate acyltransferase [Saprospiraceae bacterium]